MPKTISILITEFNGGGVSRMMVNLANGLAQLDQSVELILKVASAPFLKNLQDSVKQVHLQTENPTHTLTEALSQHLETSQPHILLSAMLKDHQLASAAKQLSTCKPRLFFRSGTNYAAEVNELFILKRAKKRALIRDIYRQADGLIAVSQGVAEGLAAVCELPVDTVHVLKNPTVSTHLLTEANAAVTHSWLKTHTVPVVVSTGDLSRRKNYELLIDAMAQVNQTQPCRLIIIGGDKRKRQQRLQKRVNARGLYDQVCFHGFCENPYPYMKQADLTVLSSNREGSPNVLVESMAVGTPVVSTDCPSGPTEALQGGRYGILVPVKSPKLLAQGIIDMLKAPTSTALLQQAVLPYQQQYSAIGYLHAFGMSGSDNLSPAMRQEWQQQQARLTE